MTKADQLVDRAASRLQKMADKAAAEEGVAAKLAQPLADDAAFLRKLKPSLILARAKGEAPTNQKPAQGVVAPSGPQLGKRPNRRGSVEVHFQPRFRQDHGADVAPGHDDRVVGGERTLQPHHSAPHRGHRGYDRDCTFYLWRAQERRRVLAFHVHRRVLHAAGRRWAYAHAADSRRCPGHRPSCSAPHPTALERGAALPA